MIRRIMNTWKLNISELYTTLIFMAVCEIFGMIIVALVLRFDQESSYACIGTMLAAFIGIFENIVFGILTFGCSFTTTVSFGSTRKEFLISEGVVAYINIIIEMAVLLGLYFVENTLYKMIYAGREYENVVTLLTDYRIVLGIILLLPAIRMLCGALILKFKKLAYWALWGLWMFGFLGYRSIADYIAENPEGIVARICDGILYFVTEVSGIVQIAALLAVACIFITIATLFIRKQPVGV